MEWIVALTFLGMEFVHDGDKNDGKPLQIVEFLER
jgi:hypothetical protein